MAKSCYSLGCTRYAGWIINDEDYGDIDSCAEHAGYDDWEAMQRKPKQLSVPPMSPKESSRG